MASLFDSNPAAGWPFYRHVIFDCDSTLSAVEGIDLLAGDAETRKQVIDLTNAAMSGVTPLNQVYGKRLELISPTRQAIRELAKTYSEHAIPDCQITIRALMDTGCDVYIVSGGLLEPVLEFGVSMGVPASHIRAVEVQYDQLDGQWWESQNLETDQRYLTYRHGDLAESDGKAKIITELLRDKSGASLLVGDGVSDLLARNAVSLFVGYAGVEARTRGCNEAAIHFSAPSLLPLLPLSLGSRQFFKLDPELRERCRKILKDHPLTFNRKVLERNFVSSFCSAD